MSFYIADPKPFPYMNVGDQLQCGFYSPLDKALGIVHCIEVARKNYLQKFGTKEKWLSYKIYSQPEFFEIKSVKEKEDE